MTHDATIYLILSATTLAGIAMLVSAGLAGWRGWLQLKAQEAGQTITSAAPSAGARIEIADLKERLRKLEAIAAGVDL